MYAHTSVHQYIHTYMYICPNPCKWTREVRCLAICACMTCARMKMGMHMAICIHTCICLYMYACMHVWMHGHICIHVYVHRRMNLYVYTTIDMYMQVGPPFSCFGPCMHAIISIFGNARASLSALRSKRSWLEASRSVARAGDGYGPPQPGQWLVGIPNSWKNT